MPGALVRERRRRAHQQLAADEQVCHGPASEAPLDRAPVAQFASDALPDQDAAEVALDVGDAANEESALRGGPSPCTSQLSARRSTATPRSSLSALRTLAQGLAATPLSRRRRGDAREERAARHRSRAEATAGARRAARHGDRGPAAKSHSEGHQYRRRPQFTGLRRKEVEA